MNIKEIDLIELIRDIFELYEHIGFPNVKNNIKEECYGYYG